jgi:hypothetical protein
MGKTGYKDLEFYKDIEFEIVKEKFNGIFPHKYEVFTEVCVVDFKNKNPLRQAIITKCYPHYVKDDAISYEVELFSSKEKIRVAENNLVIVPNTKDKECPKVETVEESVKITAIPEEKNINDNMIDTGIEKVQVIEDKLEDLNKNLDKKLEKVAKLTKLLFVSHFI